jgi:hypothetical protein
MALGDRLALDASPRQLRGHRTGTADVKPLDNSGKDNRLAARSTESGSLVGNLVGQPGDANPP